MAVTCDRCKALVRFDHDRSWARVCTCGSLVGHDGRRAVEYEADMPVLNDLTPFRIGHVGRFEGKEFRVTGRIRVEGANGYRNFWSLHGPDLPFQWLMNAYGNYALLATWDRPFPKDRMKGIKPTRQVKTDERDGYIAELMDNSFKFAWEGELMRPFMLPYTIEMEAGRATADKLIVHVKASTDIEALEGRMVEFAELCFEHATELAGWR